MTRTGKIARLPVEIRHQLNRRLQDGKPGKQLVVWLNSLPEVREALKEEFGARPITEQNLSEWKLGGYADWERHEGSCALVARLTDEAGDLKVAAGDGVVSDRLATLVAGMKVSTVAEGLGGGPAARETAAWLMELAYDLEPGTLSRKAAPDQAASEQPSTGTNGGNGGKAAGSQTESKPVKPGSAPAKPIAATPTKSDQIRPNRIKSTETESKQTQAGPIRSTKCPPPKKNGPWLDPAAKK